MKKKKAQKSIEKEEEEEDEKEKTTIISSFPKIKNDETWSFSLTNYDDDDNDDDNDEEKQIYQEATNKNKHTQQKNQKEITPTTPQPSKTTSKNPETEIKNTKTSQQQTTQINQQNHDTESRPLQTEIPFLADNEEMTEVGSTRYVLQVEVGSQEAIPSDFFKSYFEPTGVLPDESYFQAIPEGYLYLLRFDAKWKVKWYFFFFQNDNQYLQFQSEMCQRLERIGQPMAPKDGDMALFHFW